MTKQWIASRHGYEYFLYGSHALLLQWSKDKSNETLAIIRAWLNHLEVLALDGVIEWTSGYHSITIYLNRRQVSQKEIIDLLEESECHPYDPEEYGEPYIIPVDYSEEVAPDLPFVCQSTGLTRDQLIDIHSGVIYDVHFLGFLPGFLYLGGLDQRLHLPRRVEPRINVPAGSVAIAAGQTGIYPIDSPGGWHIIGRTNYKVFDPAKSVPSQFGPGSRIKFQPRIND